jgi:hypothetical protein
MAAGMVGLRRSGINGEIAELGLASLVGFGSLPGSWDWIGDERYGEKV